MFPLAFFTSFFISQYYFVNSKPASTGNATINGTRREYAEVVPWDPVGIPEEVELIVSYPKGIVPYYINSQSYGCYLRLEIAWKSWQKPPLHFWDALGVAHVLQWTFISYKIITARIHAAMNTIEASSCVVFKGMEFKPTQPTSSWLHFTNPKNERDCQHEPSIGVHGEVSIVIGFECMSDANLLHSVLHAIGFKDEVSHPHRDQYIRIMWENIQPRYRNLFRLLPEDTSYKVVEYDPMSIMHFHDRAYSVNGGPTIAPRVPGLLIAPSDKLSQLDIMKLRLWFGHECNKRKVGALLDKCKTVFSNSPITLNAVVNRNQSFESVDIDYGLQNQQQNQVPDEDVGQEELDMEQGSDSGGGVGIESDDQGGFDINDDEHENVDGGNDDGGNDDGINVDDGNVDGENVDGGNIDDGNVDGGKDDVDGIDVENENIEDDGLRMKKSKLVHSKKAKPLLFKRANILK